MLKLMRAEAWGAARPLVWRGRMRSRSRVPQVLPLRRSGLKAHRFQGDLRPAGASRS